jgi:DNA-binding transcriptional LysR family regulator
MRLEHLDLNLLIALDILLEEKNITQSAARLHITQSAASGILKRLRDFFEDDLLVQVGRSMQPTPYALEIQEPVREVLVTIRSTIINRRLSEPKESRRHFKIVVSDYLVTVVFTRVLQQLQNTAPHMTFEFITPSQSASDMLSRGEVDLMIVPEQYGPRGHASELIFEDDFCCLVCAETWSDTNTLSLEQYKEAGHITIGLSAEDTPGAEEHYIKTWQINRRIEVKTNDFNTLPQLVMNTSRIATIQRRLAKRYIQYLPLKILPTPIEIPIFKEYMHWNKSFASDPIHSWLRQQIKELGTTPVSV